MLLDVLSDAWAQDPDTWSLLLFVAGSSMLLVLYLLHLEMKGILCFISAQGEQLWYCDSGSFCPVGLFCVEGRSLKASPLDAMGGCAHGGRQNKVTRTFKKPL